LIFFIFYFIFVKEIFRAEFSIFILLDVLLFIMLLLTISSFISIKIWDYYRREEQMKSIYNLEDSPILFASEPLSGPVLLMGQFSYSFLYISFIFLVMLKI